MEEFHDGPEREAIVHFINVAQNRIEEYPSKLAFKAVAGHIVINWLRALLDRKPTAEL